MKTHYINKPNSEIHITTVSLCGSRSWIYISNKKKNVTCKKCKAAINKIDDSISKDEK